MDRRGLHCDMRYSECPEGASSIPSCPRVPFTAIGGSPWTHSLRPVGKPAAQGEGCTNGLWNVVVLSGRESFT
eukprot:3988070-Alexandrium_andersonii.AAC.1